MSADNMRDALTDEKCAEFRRMPGSFNDMVRAIYAAGIATQAAEIARLTQELADAKVDHVEDVRPMVAPVQAQGVLTDDQIIDELDRPGFAWENLNDAERRNLLGSIRALLAQAPAPIKDSLTTEAQEAISALNHVRVVAQMSYGRDPLDVLLTYINATKAQAPASMEAKQ